MMPNEGVSAREFWEANGTLTKCPNKRYEFRIGRLLGNIQWAKTEWCVVQDDGLLKTIYFGVTKTTAMDGLSIYGLYIWKFSMILGMMV